jgi:hypothetical protein
MCESKRRGYVLKEAENNKCELILRLSKPFRVSNNIPINDWVENFDFIYNSGKFNKDDSLKLIQMLENYQSDLEYQPILEAEVLLGLKKMKSGKAPGPDGVRNDHIKLFADLLLPELTCFLNICLKDGTFPENWRHSHLKVLYKGKGDSEDKNSYRGISLNHTLFNLLDRILHNRLYSSFIDQIPKNQYGFVRGKSTIQAVKQLSNDINSSVYEGKKPLYGLFLDVKKAFDSVDRKMIFKKLIESQKLSLVELKFLANSLDLNYLKIIDGVSESREIVQSNGVRQGGCLSPFLFNLSLDDINEVIKHIPGVKAILFADDVVLVCENLDDLKIAMIALKEYLFRRGLSFNLGKCNLLKFRNKGRGRYSKNDKLALDGVKVEFVSEFCYLGVVFQASGISFGRHIEKRSRAALMATYGIKELNLLSIGTAIKLFNLKISPTASYAIEVVWPYLTKKDLENLERVKTRYFKKALGLSKFTRSRYVYELVGEDLFVNDLKNRFQLPDTNNYLKFCEEKSKNKNSICQEFYKTETMTKSNWKQGLFKDRHVFTRFACHGYHYLFCSNQSFHFEPSNECVCKFCGKHCNKYHILDCEIRDMSLREASVTKK